MPLYELDSAGALEKLAAEMKASWQVAVGGDSRSQAVTRVGSGVAE
jgi:hypothetical protein